MSAKPNLQPTLQALIDRERRGLDEHPTPETLVVYHAGEIPADEQEDLRNHLALCHDCADLLLDLVSFAEFTPPEQTPALADGEVESAWQKFQPRLVAREEALPAVAQLAERRRDVDRSLEYAVVSWQRKLRRAQAIAATLLLGVVGLSLWAGSLYREREKGSQPRASAQINLLSEGDVTRSGGNESESTVPPNAETFFIALHLDPTWKEVGSYEAEILREDASKPSFIVSGLLDREGVCSFYVPSRKDFTPGRYLVDLYGIEEGRREKLARFQLQIAGPP